MNGIIALIIGIATLTYVTYYITVGVKNENFEQFPYRYEELNITEKPIEEFLEVYYIGNSYFDLVKFPYSKIYFYKNFLVVNYRGHAQIFEYNSSLMEIKNNFPGRRISILTDMGEAYFFVNKKRANIFKFLLENSSH